MTEHALASSSYPAGKQEPTFENPFASPATIRSHSPAIPQPCAHSEHSLRRPMAAVANAETDSRHDRSRQPSMHKPAKAGSMSSNGDSAVMTPMSSIDLEKAGLAKERAAKRPTGGSRGSKRSRRISTDPEKAVYVQQNDSHHSNNHVPIQFDEDEDEVDEARQVQEEKAVRILFFMSGPCVILSAINTAWACIALVITALAQPIRLCSKRPSFGQQLAGLLGPTLNLQLRCIYTPLPPYANEDGSYHTFMLAAVHILSPFLSFCMMFAAWVLAVYWLCSGVVGDPAGQDKRDDGKETVLGLRNWWESWLMRGIREA